MLSAIIRRHINNHILAGRPDNTFNIGPCSSSKSEGHPSKINDIWA